jgi:hypothetical protein
MAKVRAGIMACEGQRCESHDHNAPVVVFKNEKGTLAYSCDWCGRAPYARPGTGQHEEWTEAMQRAAPNQDTQRGEGAQPEPKKSAPAGAEQEKHQAKAGAGTFFG